MIWPGIRGNREIIREDAMGALHLCMSWDHCATSQKRWNQLLKEFSHDGVYASLLEV